MTAPIRSLDARYYTDPQIFAQEQAGLLAQTWQFACHTAELPDPGSYVTFAVAGESLFAIRGNDQKIRVFYNVCQHRAHQLVSGMGQTRVVVCPYHAWTYELTGALRAGPNLKVVEGFDPGSVCLTQVRCEEFLGFLFVNLDPDAAPMDAWFPQARAQLAEWVPHWAALRPLEWVEIPEACNWKVSVENYSECYHCALNHPTFANGVVKPETYDIQPQGMCLRHTTECQNLENMTYDIRSGFDHFAEYSSWFLWPMFSFQVYPGERAEHLPLAGGGYRTGGGLARLVFGPWGRGSQGAPTGQAGPRHHRGRGHHAGRIRAARDAVAGLPTRTPRDRPEGRREFGTSGDASAALDARGNRRPGWGPCARGRKG